MSDRGVDDVSEHTTPTYEAVEPIIRKTYGATPMALALAAHVAAKIDGGDFDSRGREYAVMRLCWDWFSGGSTAESVARKIEEVLHA